ncbi:MAG: hypothetical protein H0X29_07950 [Parachlamydiaceae bacterium]|nr:hypothetical protein [Parachlamydiaceae bacterium]
MVNFVSSFIESIHENIDPSYLKDKDQAKKNLKQIGLTSTATLVTSIVFGILGISLTASGAAIGLPLILVSLPIGYLSFNVYNVSKNINDILDNPKDYQRLFVLDPGYDKQKIKTKLEQGTFCFSWIIELALDEVAKSNNMR